MKDSEIIMTTINRLLDYIMNDGVIRFKTQKENQLDNLDYFGRLDSKKKNL